MTAALEKGTSNALTHFVSLISSLVMALVMANTCIAQQVEDTHTLVFS
jgi:predicted membrane channel-forming protein YqfA (hemolysin III family)